MLCRGVIVKWEWVNMKVDGLLQGSVTSRTKNGRECCEEGLGIGWARGGARECSLAGCLGSEN